MRHPIYAVGRAAALTLLLLLGACAGTSDLMQNVPADKTGYATRPDQALIVFMRPSGLGFAVQSSVFDITSREPDFIAVVPAKTKFAHYSPPGQRRFMVIGESADFMDATLDPGKVYYALVTPRMGMWKARFSLRALDAAAVGSKDFDDWFKETRWVETQPAAATWSRENMASIKEKMNDDLDEWVHKADKPTLHPGDGQPALYVPKPEK